MDTASRSGDYRISVLAHFIACENGWRGTAYLYRAGQARPCRIVYDASLCATRDEAEAGVRLRAQASIEALASSEGAVDEEACIPAPCPEK